MSSSIATVSLLEYSYVTTSPDKLIVEMSISLGVLYDLFAISTNMLNVVCKGKHDSKFIPWSTSCPPFNLNRDCSAPYPRYCLLSELAVGM